MFLLFYISEYISHKIFHILSVIIGLYIIHHYVHESLNVLIVYVLFSYAILYVPKKLHSGIGIFLPSLLMIAYWYVLVKYFLKITLYFILYTLYLYFSR